MYFPKNIFMNMFKLFKIIIEIIKSLTGMTLEAGCGILEMVLNLMALCVQPWILPLNWWVAPGN